MTRRILAALATATLLASCTSKDKAAGTPAEGSSEKPAASAALTVKGSDTMVLLAQRLAESFMAKNAGKVVQVTGGGSGTGIAALINGTTAIANASRPINEKEKTQVLETRGKGAVETKIALDGIAIYVHEANPVKELDLEQLAKIYLGKVKNWKEVGGEDSAIVLYGRENNSGTYAYFKEHVLRDEDFADETQTLPGTAAVVHAVAKDPKAIGYGGIAYGTGVRAVPVKKEASSAAVEPSMENVTNGSYPISRFLYMYTVGEPTGDAKDFLGFALSEEGQGLATKAGYYPLPKP
ncbi:phosphate ABC transporter substrate-binding protein [Vulgatibacter incomptus]|uniref:Phosphate-binding protein n=1 Tax=Vulgatibacter incomptus TaxID=1391653 RepID=A0A0K1PEX2_9BACT|nr:phosphate ABC transporter substrate-binding protein [Vulgatibacter incomptus]AKU92078.1 Phosphate ABC transporter, periplasmic phosphate-binding protein PstS [Vulgatibacter incomptus]